MSFKEFLNYTIIDSKHFFINVYDIFLALIIILAAITLTRAIRSIFKRMEKKGKLDKGTGWSIFSIIKYFLWVIITVLILDTFGVKISILLASFAALLIGVGLGIQQLFSDIASGIIILVEGNLKMSDVIQLDDGTVGRVLRIGLRTSKIRTRDNIIMIVPNSNFVNDSIINWSHMERSTRFYVQVGVAYGSDVRLVEKVLLQCAAKHEGVSKTPSPFVRFYDFGDSSLDFQLFFWADRPFFIENIKSDLRFFISDAFRDNKIQIPFPQRDVHIKNS